MALGFEEVRGPYLVVKGECRSPNPFEADTAPIGSSRPVRVPGFAVETFHPRFGWVAQHTYARSEADAVAFAKATLHPERVLRRQGDALRVVFTNDAGKEAEKVFHVKDETAPRLSKGQLRKLAKKGK